MTKPQTIYVKTDLQWVRPEWADDKSQALVAHAAGYEFEIGPNPDQKKWDWLVRVTAEISETPEVLGTGTAASKSGAVWAAGLCANRDQKQRAKANEPKPKAAAPKAKEKTAGELLAAVEDQVAAEVEPKPRKRSRKQTTAEEPVSA